MSETKMNWGPAHPSYPRLIQPSDLPRCLVTEAERGVNFLEVNETVQYGGLATFPDEETARRVAALWNACAGIPTAALEGGALGKALEAMRRVYDLTSEEAARVEMEIALRSLGRLK